VRLSVRSPPCHSARIGNSTRAPPSPMLYAPWVANPHLPIGRPGVGLAWQTSPPAHHKPPTKKATQRAPIAPTVTHIVCITWLQHRLMAWGGHGLPKVSPGPAIPYPSTPCGQTTPKTSLQLPQGWPVHIIYLFFPDF
jgi:hypothetical protein